MVLCDYYHPPFSQRGVIQPKALDENARKLIQAFDVRTPSSFVSAGKLSGGNQQKVIVARELSRPVKLVIANQPTRGLDVGSIEYITARSSKCEIAAWQSCSSLLNWMRSWRSQTASL
jgi:ABC-type uncharacterized transport system ATPase subunit